MLTPELIAAMTAIALSSGAGAVFAIKRLGFFGPAGNDGRCPDSACQSAMKETIFQVGSLADAARRMETSDIEQYGLLREMAKDLSALRADVAHLRGRAGQ
jgi:hypothetical protein